jgi:CrcB protein
MPKLLLIALGGATGAILRYSLSGLVQTWSGSASFPYGTLAVNIVGCFVIGFLSQLVESYGLFSSEARAFVFIGLLGAFTTYSTFANESVNLARDGQSGSFLFNLGLHVFLGLAAVWLGRILVDVVWR